MATKNRPPMIRIHKDELIVDNFAGGGGASTGISWALGRDPDIAINHNAEAIAMHKVNHPTTKHYTCDVFEVDPLKACGMERPWREGDPFRVGLGWFSPDCTFHSKARGAKPFRDRNAARRRRGLAGVVLKWAELVRPRIIAMENVEEFQDWGPLVWDGKKKGWVPDDFKRGFNFRRFVARLENLNYKVEWREMQACDFGAPTTRNRLFVMARCDGEPIVWPEATHGEGEGMLPYRTAAECIDWDIPCPSIFMTRAEAKKFKDETGIAVQRPLSAKTMRRIAAGVKRYVLGSGKPFIVPVTHGKSPERVHDVDDPMRTVTAANRGELAVVSPVLIQTSWGERKGQRPRYLNIHEPVGTIMAGGIKHSVVQARLERVAGFVAKHFGGEHESGEPKSPGQSAREPLGTVTTRDHNYAITAHLVNLRGSMDERQTSSQELTQPAPTITAGGNHAALVYAFMVKYYGTEQDPRLEEPMHTLTTKDRMALVTVTIDGEEYAIVDIGMRMLTPPELFRAMGFPPHYIIDPVVEREVQRGKKRVKVTGPLPKTSQVHMCGNAVCPPAVEALLTANFAVCEEKSLEAVA